MPSRDGAGTAVHLGNGAEVLQAGTLGLQLPFVGVVMFISLLIAVHATESMVGRCDAQAEGDDVATTVHSTMVGLSG